MKSDAELENERLRPLLDLLKTQLAKALQSVAENHLSQNSPK